MDKKVKLMNGVVNPFSDNFLETWDLWKRFKKEEFNFQYKGCISEQVALMALNNLSNGTESIAVEIVMQSIENTWKGLFPLKNKANGQSDKNTTGKGLRDSVQAEFNLRNEKRRQSAG